MKFYSHPGILLKDHLRGVAGLCRKYVERVKPELSEIGELIGLTHDLGKYTEFFQHHLAGKKVGKLRKHSRLSAILAAWIASKRCRRKTWIVFNCVLSHHSRLKSADREHFRVLWDWVLEEQLKSMKRGDVVKELEELGLEELVEFLESPKASLEELAEDIIRCPKGLEAYFDTVLLYSSLVDADRKDAGKFSPPEVRIDSLSRKIREYVSKIEKRGRIDDLRRELFRSVSEKVENLEEEQRILTITAPTGMGKTLLGLYVAARLQERFGNDRIIYALPYISIVDQTYSVIKSVLEIEDLNPELLLKQHHLAFRDVNFDEETSELYQALSDSWDSKIIVTTFEQLVKSIIGSRASSLRRFHNLAGSVIILDEVQSIPVECWKDIREIAVKLTEYGCRIVLMTATMPRIFSGLEVTPEVDVPSRYTIVPVVDNEMNVSEFLDFFEERWNGESALIVVNTVGISQSLYEELKKRLGVEGLRFGKVPESDAVLAYLSRSIVPRDRTWKINVIRKLLEEDKSVLLVSTQIVEAGVDIDFKVAFRDLGPIDSIVQTAGRCNRNFSSDFAQVFVVKLEDKGREKIYGKIAIEQSQRLLTCELSEKNLRKALSSYYEEIERRMSMHRIIRDLERLQFDKLEEFSLIKDEPKDPVFVELNEEAEKIRKDFRNLLESLKATRSREEYFKIRRKIREKRALLEDYMVEIWRNKLEQLKLASDEKLGIYLIPRREVDYYYDPEVGIRGDYEQFW